MIESLKKRPKKNGDDKISIKINNNRIKIPTMRFKLAQLKLICVILYFEYDYMNIAMDEQLSPSFYEHKVSILYASVFVCAFFFGDKLLNFIFIWMLWNSKDSNKVRSIQSSYSKKVNRAHISDSDKGTEMPSNWN